MHRLTYLPSEIQARFVAWAQARHLTEVSAYARDELWASYVDARDGLSPGTTLQLMRDRQQGIGFIYEKDKPQVELKHPKRGTANFARRAYINRNPQLR